MAPDLTMDWLIKEIRQATGVPVTLEMEARLRVALRAHSDAMEESWLRGGGTCSNYGQTTMPTIPAGLFSSNVTNGYERYQRPSAIARFCRDLDDDLAALDRVAAANPRAWVRDALPVRCGARGPRRLGLKRYKYHPPGARVRLTRTQFAIL